MAEINLLQPQRKPRFEVHAPQGSGNFLLWGLVGLIALELLAWGGLFFWKKSVISEVSEQQVRIAELDKKIESHRDELEVAVKDQGLLNSFSSLLDDHLYWTNIWKTLGQYTLKNVQYLSIEASAEQDKFVVSGKVMNFTELARLLLGLQSNENFTEVELMNTKTDDREGQQGVTFQIAVAVKHELLTTPVKSSTPDSLY